MDFPFPKQVQEYITQKGTSSQINKGYTLFFLPQLPFFLVAVGFFQIDADDSIAQRLKEVFRLTLHQNVNK